MHGFCYCHNMTASSKTQSLGGDFTALVQALQQVLPGLRQAWVFGSVARGTAGSNSDIDVAVEAGHRLTAEDRIRLIDALALCTGRPVDLIDLKTVGEPLLGQILQHGVHVFGSQSDHAELLRRHLFDVEDFQPYITRILQERRRAWIG